MASELFSEVDKLRTQMLTNVELMADQRVHVVHNDSEVLALIEDIILKIVTSLSKDEAPVLSLPNRSSWVNVRYLLQHCSSLSTLYFTTFTHTCDSPASITKFAQIVKILSVIYKLIQSNTYATKRDIYYNDTQLFGSQAKVDHIVDDISCLLKVPRRSLHVLATSKGLITGDLCYLEEDGTRIDCRSSTAFPVSSNIGGIKNIVSSAKFVLIVEKDATFQRLLDDDLCAKLAPCIMITGKGVPDVNSRLMVRKLWDALHVPIFAMVDADPYGIEIMCIYKYGSLAMSFEARSLTVPSVMWLGLLPSDLQRLRVPENALIPLTKKDETKLNSLLKRPYLQNQPDWQKEIELMQQSKSKAEIQALTAIAPDFLSSIYLPNKLRYGGWV
uniref:DNA topoisomerase (ATP-hydrolyzing) n=1 Tax=Neogobius melanostomus TaxID=47308 RepID=A0A8C6UYY5_9GOBI